MVPEQECRSPLMVAARMYLVEPTQVLLLMGADVGQEDQVSRPFLYLNLLIRQCSPCSRTVG